MSIIARIKAKFKPKEINLLTMRANGTDAHLIALCRLLFIKPEVLYREVNNIKANGEYLTKLMQAKIDEENGTTKKNTK